MKFVERIANIFPCVRDLKKAVLENTQITHNYICLAKVRTDESKVRVKRG